MCATRVGFNTSNVLRAYTHCIQHGKKHGMQFARTAQFLPQISPHGGKTKWQMTSISFSISIGGTGPKVDFFFEVPPELP